MNIHDSVEEENFSSTTLLVFHRHLKVPLESYLSAVQEFTDPWDERAYQYFIHHYLQELGDPGLVGMVRKEQSADFLFFDAAVRYPVSE
ncbi:hypothetical protein [Desulfitobacterium metallireducens]|uniref:Uncharacterized protein n=1 Tax=Desulfitobacterium metallireducens DSM 15288 TaxID=871968 RepID=W0E959_9FIRM|nr:hypothetical protein [Desulfitobacterium metallireducens]AHF07287.1 hypothetical protein DESME_09815 [Desulfitobacterium metallireducens DSM 15288]